MAANREVAHNWAHQTGKCCNGSNFYYVGDTIYSYGRHFPAAKIVAPELVLVNRDNYSPSTGRHMSYVRQAIPSSWRTYDVLNVRASAKWEHKANFLDFKGRVDAELASACKRRSAELRASDIGYARSIAETANEYRLQFKIGNITRAIPVPEITEEMVAAAKVAKKRKAEKVKKERVKIQMQVQEHLVKWRANEIVSIPWQYCEHHIVRLRVRDGEVQSNKSARFPASEAYKAWQLITLCRKTNTRWRPHGHEVKLGDFRVNTVTPKGVLVAGCHTVPYEESKYIAEQLGLVEEDK